LYNFEHDQKAKDKAKINELYELSAAETDPVKKEALLVQIDQVLRAQADPNSVPEAMMDLDSEGSAANPIRVGPPTVVSEYIF